MLNFFGSVINFINVDKRTEDIIKNSEINRKIEKDIFEPIIENNYRINDKNGKKRNEKIANRSFENRIRKILTNYFNTEFKKVRPNFLKSFVTKRNLELDMYSEKLKISLEYNGIQHIKYCPWYHKSEKDFHDQIFRDHLKARLCREHGIKMITINYYEIKNPNDILDSEILDIILEKMSKII
jgi:hypothetical protein